MSFEVITLLIRHILGFAASYLVTVGFLQQTDTEKFIGAVLFLVTLIWSFFNKKKLTASE